MARAGGARNTESRSEVTKLIETGVNVIAVQLVNADDPQDDDAFFDARLVGASGGAAGATPGRLNSTYNINAAPQMRQVEHNPLQPISGQPVTITAKVTDPDGVVQIGDGQWRARTNRATPIAAVWPSSPRFRSGCCSERPRPRSDAVAVS